MQRGSKALHSHIVSYAFDASWGNKNIYVPYFEPSGYILLDFSFGLVIWIWLIKYKSLVFFFFFGETESFVFRFLKLSLLSFKTYKIKGSITRLLMIYYYTKKIRKTNNQRIVFALGSDIDQF